jgi:hypothetical protein
MSRRKLARSGNHIADLATIQLILGELTKITLDIVEVDPDEFVLELELARARLCHRQYRGLSIVIYILQPANEVLPDFGTLSFGVRLQWPHFGEALEGINRR